MLHSEVVRALRRQGFQVRALPARGGVVGVRSSSLAETRVEVVPALGPAEGWWVADGWQAPGSGPAGEADLIVRASLAADNVTHLRSWCRAIFGVL